MKIETDILRTGEGEYAWADEVAHGFMAYAAGRDVPDAFLLKHGLIEPEPEPEAEAPKTPSAPAKKTAAPKQSPKPADKSVKGPAADK